ncbi:ATP-binding protein [Catenulispora sp. NL8]|uniref:ATP-binding protein n=1 Tax=Catenulispora pinistramenti TaxID=2705254 RepID=A0ABS5L442_9ACTN|nr:ATP-binding protein [Catenulispora pinistramenti]MBS2553087.1 ATP-binding protein [Catenulispora pinistramenti]
MSGEGPVDAPAGVPVDIPGSIPGGIPADIPVDAAAARRCLDLLLEQVRALIDARSATDPNADDPLRGLRLSADHVGWLLSADPVRGQVLASADRWPRLAELAETFGLTGFDVAVLVLALAPDLDRVFESCYGYLNDDVTRRRATVGLALDLCGYEAWDPAARARFGAGAPLADGGLLELEDADRPLLSRGLRVPDRVVAHLLGDDTPDDLLHGLIQAIEVPAPRAEPSLRPELDHARSDSASRLAEPALQSDLPGDAKSAAGLEAGSAFAAPDSATLAEIARRPGLVDLLRAGPTLVQLREQRKGSADAVAVALFAAAGRPALRITLTDQLLTRADQIVPALIREARLRRAGLVVFLPEPIDPGPFCTDRVPVLLVGEVRRESGAWPVRPLVVDVESPAGGSPEWIGRWRAELGPLAPGTDLEATVAPFRLTATGIARASETARALAALEGRQPDESHIRRAARQENARGMGPGVRHVEPAVGWPDLVLPEQEGSRLRELVDRVRNRDRVLGAWGLRTGGGRGRGVAALFAGESGTGKTLAAEVVAGELGLDLYVVELSALVDKYVGETEKNLERLFAEADRVDAVILFDEADAVFGKRSETKDAHDRYANMESAYLLQRLESFNGVALLTTNLRANIDDAFTRRFDLIVDFPFPDAALRKALWRRCLAGPVPLDPDVADGSAVDPVADRFELAGGAIRAAATTAAYLAAAGGRAVSAEDLLTGARREYRKMGRLSEEDLVRLEF